MQNVVVYSLLDYLALLAFKHGFISRWNGFTGNCFIAIDYQLRRGRDVLQYSRRNENLYIDLVEPAPCIAESNSQLAYLERIARAKKE